MTLGARLLVKQPNPGHVYAMTPDGRSLRITPSGDRHVRVQALDGADQGMGALFDPIEVHFDTVALLDSPIKARLAYWRRQAKFQANRANTLQGKLDAAEKLIAQLKAGGA